MSSVSSPEWSLVQAFLAVAETGSLSEAARRLGTTQPTVGRHVQALEAALAVPLFRRQARGMALTEQGAALVPHAKAMRGAAEALNLTAAGEDTGLAGTVRITASEVVSHYVLPPVIAELRESLPEIAIELVASDRSENLLFREADIAVRMYRPRQLDMVARHLGVIELGLFGAPAYLERRGRPERPEDLAAHEIVGFDTNEDLIRGFRAAGWPVTRDYFKVRCDNQTVCWELVRAGCGLGFGQMRIGLAEPAVEHLPLEMEIPELQVWLTAHEAVRRTPRVDAVWRVLAERLTAVCDRPG